MTAELPIVGEKLRRRIKLRSTMMPWIGFARTASSTPDSSRKNCQRVPPQGSGSRPAGLARTRPRQQRGSIGLVALRSRWQVGWLAMSRSRVTASKARPGPIPRPRQAIRASGRVPESVVIDQAKDTARASRGSARPYRRFGLSTRPPASVAGAAWVARRRIRSPGARSPLHIRDAAWPFLRPTRIRSSPAKAGRLNRARGDHAGVRWPGAAFRLALPSSGLSRSSSSAVLPRPAARRARRSADGGAFAGRRPHRAVEKVRDPWLDRDALKISVFMNVFNVHSQPLARWMAR